MHKTFALFLLFVSLAIAWWLAQCARISPRSRSSRRGLSLRRCRDTTLDRVWAQFLQYLWNTSIGEYALESLIFSSLRDALSHRSHMTLHQRVSSESTLRALSARLSSSIISSVMRCLLVPQESCSTVDARFCAARVALPGNIMLEWLGPQANLVGAGVFALVGWLLCAAAPTVSYWLYFLGFLLSQGTRLLQSPCVVLCLYTLLDVCNATAECHAWPHSSRARCVSLIVYSASLEFHWSNALHLFVDCCFAPHLARDMQSTLPQNACFVVITWWALKL